MPRRVLILGGTGWLGAAIARAAVADGAEVTCLARGVSGEVPAGARLVSADRAESGAYAALMGEWDEVVELSYEPDLVGSALTTLADRARHWTLVSTVSVYRDHTEPGADESAAVVEPDDLTEYGQAKVAAERATAARVGDRLLIARPGLIVGPGDPSDRFGYWPGRMLRGGEVLVPRTDERFAQMIDVDDLAGWLVRSGGDGATGTVDAVGPPVPLASVLEAAAVHAGFSGDLHARDDDWLLGHDVAYWAGPRSLPLWLPSDAAGFARRSDAAFRAAGGTTRSLEEIVDRVAADESGRGLERPRRAGLTPAEEADLLAAS